MNRVILQIILGIAIALSSHGCKKSPSSQGPTPEASGGAAPAAVPAIEREAQQVAVDEVGKHWAKGTDGWTTAITSGSPYAPDHYLRQFRDLTVHAVEPSELDESDRLNGLEWAGQVSFNTAPCREAGDPGLVLDGLVGVGISRQRGRWTQWVNFQPQALRVRKVRGQWQVTQDTFLLHGNPPGPQDYANAQVH